MTDSWNINVGGRSYGPYSLQQMQGFVAEGRLAPHSRVSQPGSDVIVSATDDDVNSPKFGRSSDAANGAERGRYLIIADMKSRSISGLEEEILNLGPAYALLPQIWLLVSDQSMNAIRNALV